MKLWLLEPKKGLDGEHGPAWENHYDCYFGHVIRAESEAEARAMAPHGDEDGDAWTNPDKSSCVELTADGAAGVILSDFLAG